MPKMPALTEYASPYNWVEGGQNPKPSKKVEIHDLTLEGDGEEMAGLRFRHEERVRIAKLLDAAGVHRISVLGNSPRPTQDEIKSADAIANLGLKAKVGAFVKTAEEIKTCAHIGLWGVTILVGVNDAVLTGGRTGQDIIDQCKRLTETARELDLHTCLMGMDATRTRSQFLERVVRELDPFFDEFVVADSLGRISPFGIRNLVALVRQWTTKPLQVHPHNHTSMAVANCVGAVLGGASIVQTVVNGLGEFTGIAATEECAVALEMHAGVTLQIDRPRLQELAKLVSQASGLPIPPNKPITGRSAFAIPETEEIQEVLYQLHCEGRFNDGLPFPPEIVGATARMSIGRKCNAFTVLYNLQTSGIQVSQVEAEEIATKVRARLESHKGYVLMEQSELLQLARESAAGRQ
jgi:isopropylmalate/homocitrate/citramalate synthase